MTSAPAASTVVMTAVTGMVVVIQNRDTKRELAITRQQIWTYYPVKMEMQMT